MYLGVAHAQEDTETAVKGEPNSFTSATNEGEIRAIREALIEITLFYHLVDSNNEWQRWRLN